MDFERFLDVVRTRGGAPSDEEAERIAAATLSVLGELLPYSRRRRVVSRLPAPWSDAIDAKNAGQSFDRHGFYERVAAELDVTIGQGLEQSQAVLEALAGALDDNWVRYLKKHLPDEFEELLTPRVIPDNEPRRRQESGPRKRPTPAQTLASGRLGSANPLSESRGDYSQTNSVARTSNPHADRKLSSGAGITLASGRPGPDRPVNEYRMD